MNVSSILARLTIRAIKAQNSLLNMMSAHLSEELAPRARPGCLPRAFLVYVRADPLAHMNEGLYVSRTNNRICSLVEIGASSIVSRKEPLKDLCKRENEGHN
ncbi:uncharacterized protein MCYG_02293 [Microsporum canis CBS 113480]|uniref:Uncharacterized protein n=1 Tax=Arthroderma otae (strain ATCC MYA-4605 / CBS 113480) TaxID=554155 RepID=C5FFM7_ARTOC|nr:uncharacterized protein MCYG_02293 [Microsporum canis CBS 113480]EEQ29474.1 predicted protein [Microsporum canis CBS 113480]